MKYAHSTSPSGRISRLLLATLPLVILASALLVRPAAAQDGYQEPQHRLSPVVIERTTVGDTYMKVVYGQPWVRGRTIFGELVPFDQVWRTGANEGTEIYFQSDVTFGEEHVPAGLYTLFTIPGETAWTVILNSQLGQWGLRGYDAEHDVARVVVPVSTTDEPVEGFSIRFLEDEGDADVKLTISWERTTVSVPVSER
jgi:hypothetical protein